MELTAHHLNLGCQYSCWADQEEKSEGDWGEKSEAEGASSCSRGSSQAGRWGAETEAAAVWGWQEANCWFGDQETGSRCKYCAQLRTVDNNYNYGGFINFMTYAWLMIDFPHTFCNSNAEVKIHTQYTETNGKGTTFMHSWLHSWDMHAQTKSAGRGQPPSTVTGSTQEGTGPVWPSKLLLGLINLAYWELFRLSSCQ